MDFPCESEINVRNDNALRFTIISKPAPIIEYLKTIASLIGASHILGVFEDNDFIKVYFDDKKYVETLIRSGIHVMGHHIKVDYVVPPGEKVILSNVDPVVSNYDLTRLMSMFGSVVSPVFRSPISDDTELCHIDYGVRYVYMNLNKELPNSLEFNYADQICRINMKLDAPFAVVPYVKAEPDESNTTESSSNSTHSNDNADPISVDDDQNTANPVVVSVQSAADEVNSDQQITIDQSSVETNNLNLRKAKPRKLVKASKINKRIRHNVKFKSKRAKRFRITRKRQQIEISCSIEESPQTPLEMQSLSLVSSSPKDSSAVMSDTDGSFVIENSKSVLDDDQLKSFLEEVRCHRAPIELVKKHIGSNFDSKALLSLIKQLTDFKKATDDHAVKVRIFRLVNNLKKFLSK